ncbi:universal stress protein [Aggregatimonas sangjinii]|uniref:Universal stress protein n=1 Tax=Aggregatimonas sangjinii TaxID=2583587 RepID=A0A5B7SS90_9FLAO|nr:universal stress protein [Aggregatimonas sangjinii]QCW99513.1 universal stress protein [Aggregatimonas sangjinii]
MKKIIVPVDFSIQSEYAMKAACSLAKKHEAEILALHMPELNRALISSSEGFHPEQTVFLIKLAEKRFNNFLNKPYTQGITITPIVKHFKVFSEVNEVADKHDADLIIMGSHGAEGFKEIFVGSNTEKVVRTADVPVGIIKDEIPDFAIERFVFACDFKEENLDAYSKAKAFADLLNANIELVYINTPGDSFLSTLDAYGKINRFFDKAGNGQEMDIYNDYTVEQGILNFAEGTEADLIGIPTHGRKGLAHFFRGSIGEDIANHAKLPVVTFKI